MGSMEIIMSLACFCTFCSKTPNFLLIFCDIQSNLKINKDISWFWNFWSAQNPNQHASVVHMVARGTQTSFTVSGGCCSMGKGCSSSFLKITFQSKVGSVLVVTKLCTFRNTHTYIHTWVCQHYQEEQVTFRLFAYVCFSYCKAYIKRTAITVRKDHNVSL